MIVAAGVVTGVYVIVWLGVFSSIMDNALWNEHDTTLSRAFGCAALWPMLLARFVRRACVNAWKEKT